MGFIKNLKDKAKNQLGDNLKELLEKNGIADNLKDTINNTLDNLATSWLESRGKNESLEKFKPKESIKDLGQEPETSSDCKIPFSNDWLDYLKNKNYDVTIDTKSVIGVKTFDSEKNTSMFNCFAGIQLGADCYLLTGSVAWDFDINQEEIKAMAQSFKKALGEKKIIGGVKGNQLAIHTPLMFNDNIGKEELKSGLDEITSALTEISERLYSYLLPIVEIKEQEEEIRRLEEEIKAAEEARERGLKNEFYVFLDPEYTIRDMQEKFNDEFNYLRIGVFQVQTGQKADKEGGQISPISENTLFSKVRSYKGDCNIIISGSDTPEDLEKRFRKDSGLVIKICYNDDENRRIYISKGSSLYKEALYDINTLFKDNGYYKAEIS